jgi:heterotetrameric sarcosine oxidase gamma subunit
MHPDSFPVGGSLVTGINHLAVHLWRPSEDRVMVTLLRSFARDLFEFLSTMSLEYGYRVEA